MTPAANARTRTYGQFCPVAAGMDMVGDRWTLLICRELITAPRRFTELRRALPGLAPNLLTERLRQLQDAGLLEAADEGYRLTDKGRGVIPIIRAYALFGVNFINDELNQASDKQATDAFRTARAFLAPWASAGTPMRVRVTVPDGSQADIVVGARTVRPVGAPDGDADIEITTSAPDLMRMRKYGEPLAAQISGPSKLVTSFVDAFHLTLAA